MRILGVGDSNDLGALYLGLAAAGHEVRVVIDDPDARDVLAGMVARADSLDSGLAWASEARSLILFEGVGRGELQDSLRRQGHRVVGGSAFGDRLEMDRAFGQEMLRGLGLPIVGSHTLDGWGEAIDFVERNRRRMVLKFTGGGYASTRSYVGVMPDGRDLLGVLRLQSSLWRHDERPQILLMDHL